MSDWSGNAKAIDFGSKLAMVYVDFTQDKFILFDSIISLEQAKALHRWLGDILNKDGE